MPYVIITRSAPATLAQREALRPAHIEHLRRHQHLLLLAAGGLLEDDGARGNGGVMLLDTEDRAVAEVFLAGDPFQQAGLFTTVRISRWRKAFFNFVALVWTAPLICAPCTFLHMGAIPRL